MPACRPLSRRTTSCTACSRNGKGKKSTPIRVAGPFPAQLILSVRDGVVRDRLAANTYPFAEFTATGVEGLPARYAEGQVAKLSVPGNLTIREVTRSVSFQTEVTLRGDTMSGAATADILMTDFGAEPPSIGQTTVENAVTIAVQLSATAAAAQAPSATLADRNPKLDSELAGLARTARDRGTAQALQEVRELGFYVADGSVRVIVEGAGRQLDSARAALVTAGAQIESERAGAQSLFQVIAPVAAIGEIADLPEVRSVHATFGEMPDANGSP